MKSTAIERTSVLLDFADGFCSGLAAYELIKVRGQIMPNNAMRGRMMGDWWAANM